MKRSLALSLLFLLAGCTVYVTGPIDIKGSLPGASVAPAGRVALQNDWPPVPTRSPSPPPSYVFVTSGLVSTVTDVQRAPLEYLPKPGEKLKAGEKLATFSVEVRNPTPWYLSGEVTVDVTYEGQRPISVARWNVSIQPGEVLALVLKPWDVIDPRDSIVRTTSWVKTNPAKVDAATIPANLKVSTASVTTKP